MGPPAFEELGLQIAERGSSEAEVEAARLLARRCLDGEVAPRSLARCLFGVFVRAGYPDELNAFVGLDDCYIGIDDGWSTSSLADADAAVLEAAQELVEGSERSQ